MKISERLHRAADVYLSAKDDETESTRYFSCDAVFFDSWDKKTAEFLYDIGLDNHGYHEFDEFRNGIKRQGARYLWLKFAALVAESEGL